MTRVAALVTFRALPGHGSEVARLMAAALPQALEEEPMPLWLVLQPEHDPDTVYIADVFSDAAGRDQHLQAATARRILSAVPGHLVAAPAIVPLRLLAAKGL